MQIFLKEKWNEIRSKNRSYSLRSFARRLGVSSSALSEFFNGKRSFSRELSLKISKNLSLGPQEISEIESKFSQEDAAKSIKIHPSFRQELELQSHQYEIARDPIYYSLLCLMETHNFQSSTKWMAKRLNVSETKIKKSLQILLAFELAEKKNGKYFPTQKSLQTTEDIANASLKRRHEENLEAAKDSLYQRSIEERDFCFMTMAIDKAKLPLAKQMIREFRNQLSAFLESGEKNEVYEMCIQLFPKTTAIQELKNIKTKNKN
ncbi:MAG: TIGR02147 family protein [Bacteriovoracaceae bacterium]|nr:TIGR02147 family protein [Bacteriovoracaceae bacterium]